MIIENSSGDIRNYGEIKEYKISIDAKNLEFITTLLSSNLYSHPEDSFIREIVSNAWDSHVEANNTNTPIIIKGTRNSDNSVDILIRDYGIGISPERYEEIYCNIGSSTKRDTNNYIGGFGLGRFSALAVSNSVYITSYYEGMRYNYVLVKSGNTIKSTLLDTQPTEDHNGVEVLVKNIPSTRVENITKAINKVGFFPNVYYGGIYEYRNENTITKLYNKFAVINNDLSGYRILIGNVLYPVNNDILDFDNKKFDFKHSGIAIRFNIGELEVTPNRESIIYNKRAIELINIRFREAIYEIKNTIVSIIGENYTDIKKYCEIIDNYIEVNLLEGTFHDKIVYCKKGELLLDSIYADNYLSNKILYKGKTLDRSDIHRVDYLFKSTVFNLKYFIRGGKLIKEVKRFYNGPTLLHKDTIILKKMGDKIVLNEALRSYLLSNFPEKTAFIGEINLDALGIYLKKERGLISDYLFSEVLKYVKDWYSKLPVIDIDTNPDILKIKADIKADRKANRFTNKKIILRYNDVAVEYNNIETAISELKNTRDEGKIITLSYIDEYPILRFIRTYIKKNLTIVEARKDIVDHLKNQNLSFIVDPKYLISESSKDLCRYAIVINYLKKNKLPDSTDYPKYFISNFIKDFADPSILYNKDVNKILEIMSIPSYEFFDYNLDYLNIDPRLYKGFIDSFKLFLDYYNKIHLILTELLSDLSINLFRFMSNKIIIAILIRKALKQKDTLRLKYSAYLIANSNKFIKSLI